MHVFRGTERWTHTVGKQATLTTEGEFFNGWVS